MKKVASIIVLLFSIISCNSLKIDKYQEKIGVLNKDFTTNFYKRAFFKSGYITFKVFESEESIPINDFFIALNGVSVGNQKEYYLDGNQKYNIKISSMGGYKSVVIPGLLIKEKDSVIVKVYLNEGAIIF